jgi:hypothetical protein
MTRTPQVSDRKLGRERAHGQYWPGIGLIQVDPRLRQDHRMRIIAHEAIHHALPDASERQVKAAARAVQSALWRDRWRRVER